MGWVGLGLALRLKVLLIKRGHLRKCGVALCAIEPCKPNQNTPTWSQLTGACEINA